MQTVRIKKGYRFHIAGSPSDILTRLPAPDRVAILPETIPHIKPRLKVSVGDAVKIGSVLFTDKNDSRFRFLSPGGGRIADIEFGPRRVIKAIVVDRQTDDEPEIEFPVVDEKQLNRIAPRHLADHIVDRGMWWVFRELPFRNLPNPDLIPPMILVGLDAQEPFQPSPAVYLKDAETDFAYGLKVLNRLADHRVVVHTAKSLQAQVDTGRKVLTHVISGCYPSDDSGTVHYHIKTGRDQNRAWFITGQDLILLARMLLLGRYPVDRVISVAGSAAPVRQHYRARMGAPLALLVDPAELKGDERLVVGGLLRGYERGSDGYLGLYETALNIVPRGGPAEFLSLFKPGFAKPSYSRTFASKFNRAPMVFDCKRHGDQRACIACMHCADVCPVDMLPQMVYKAVLAREVEEYLELGLLDCVECGLCTYVCPSKIELRQTFVETKAAYAKEQTQNRTV
ncbi:MAG: 4Fe-4S dicluster domain-containing protein [Desulfatitalea sp.]|nr:4Fe-4S dicluster domain-containing protein [Desulfatitalea sp.]NNJ99466.1 4Fe-4S dicluster domain-containing protein [Desulfatitalea sp.]